ncbi:hypothetical protein [Rhodoligotrophos ferricapiens]|uniref:hypothetical protein n=1 Tax=Rhodoligotrophos ferricapiens TaxID=3069264 RepID=UPI00315D06DD
MVYSILYRFFTQQPFIPPKEPEPRKGLINKIVVALEDSWPVDRAAERIVERFVDECNPGSIAGYAGGRNVGYVYDRNAGRLRPTTETQGLVADEHTRIDIVGRGEVEGRGAGQVSRLDGFQLAELIAPLLPQRGVEQISIVASHVQLEPGRREGVLTEGFLYEFVMGLRLRVGDGAMPNVITAELGNVAVDRDGQVRAIHAVNGGGWTTWAEDYGRVTMEVRLVNGQMHYRTIDSVPEGIQAEAAGIIRNGLPDHDAGPLERTPARSRGDTPHERPEESDAAPAPLPAPPLPQDPADAEMDIIPGCSYSLGYCV